jgi:hypothetical protein
MKTRKVTGNIIATTEKAILLDLGSSGVRVWLPRNKIVSHKRTVHHEFEVPSRLALLPATEKCRTGDLKGWERS